MVQVYACRCLPLIRSSLPGVGLRNLYYLTYTNLKNDWKLLVETIINSCTLKVPYTSAPSHSGQHSCLLASECSRLRLTTYLLLSAIRGFPFIRGLAIQGVVADKSSDEEIEDRTSVDLGLRRSALLCKRCHPSALGTAKVRS